MGWAARVLGKSRTYVNGRSRCGSRSYRSPTLSVFDSGIGAQAGSPSEASTCIRNYGYFGRIKIDEEIIIEQAYESCM